MNRNIRYKIDILPQQRASGERMASSSADGRLSPSLRLADEWERCGDVESDEESEENERSNDES